jgi:hypothetical protein
VSEYEAELVKERAAAAQVGQEYAAPLDLGVAMDVGAPLPHLLIGSRTFLLFRLSDAPDDRGGTWVRSVGVDTVGPLAVVEFFRCVDATIGGPNDEALSGHRLFGRGLSANDFFMVENSRWRESARLVNSVHPMHSDEPFDQLRHYVFTFHDETFECLADGHHVEVLVSPLKAAVRRVAKELFDPSERSPESA